MKPKVLLFSGGADSTLILYRMLAAGEAVHALCISYGQNPRETDTAGDTLHQLYKLNLPGRLSTKLLSIGDFTWAIGKDGIFHHRNALFCAIAATYAVSIGATEIVTGFIDTMNVPTLPDTEIYDQSPYFLLSLNGFYSTPSGSLRFTAPLIGTDKGDILAELAQKFPQARVWSCYAGGHEPCGKCTACKVRDHYNCLTQ